jgi:hypothetical protein
MLVDQLDEMLRKEPFTPFSIHISDGRAIHVKSREFVWHPAPASRMVWVYAESGDYAHLIDLHLVTSFTVGARSSNGRGRGSKRRRSE